MLDGARIGPAVAGLELGPAPLLRRGHAALAPQLGVGQGVDVVRVGADDQGQMQRVVLAIGEGLEAVADDGLGQGPTRAVLMQVEQGMAAEPCGVTHDGGGGAARLTRDLAVARASEQPEGGGGQDVGALEPVVGREALTAEGVPTVATAEAGDTLRARLAEEGAVAAVAPALGAKVEAAIRSRAVRGHEGGERIGHARGSLQQPCPLQSSPHNRRNSQTALAEGSGPRSGRS